MQGSCAEKIDAEGSAEALLGCEFYPVLRSNNTVLPIPRRELAEGTGVSIEWPVLLLY